MNLNFSQALNLNIWQETLIVLAVLLLIIGYFQYRRSPDIIDVLQETFRPSRLITALIGTGVYFIFRLMVLAVKWVFS